MWRQVEGFEDAYEVSSDGRVRNVRNGNLLAGSISANGYVRVSLSANGRSKQTSVHRLVAEAFVEKPVGKGEVNHKNGDKQDNSAENLEWVSRSENVTHAYYELGYRIKPVRAENISTGEVRDYASVEQAVRDGFPSVKIYNCLTGVLANYRGWRWSRPTPQPRTP